MKTIGITGTIAAGKSTAARWFRSQGYSCFDADHTGHCVLSSPALKALLAEEWGEEIFSAPFPPFGEGVPSPEDPFWSTVEVDRKRLAAMVFAPTPEGEVRRKRLEALTHPLILEEFRKFAYLAEERGEKIVFLDAALLFESGWNRLCDSVICVDASEEIRLKRAAGRGWSSEELARRQSRQWSADRKRSAADLLLMNDGSESSFFSRLKRVAREWFLDESSE